MSQNRDTTRAEYDWRPRHRAGYNARSNHLSLELPLQRKHLLCAGAIALAAGAASPAAFAAPCAGFVDIDVVPTYSYYSVVRGTKR